MSSIGPQIPTHLLNNDATEESDSKSTSVGPQACAKEEDSDEDDYAPALPPDILAARAAPPAPKVLGPTFPGASASYQDESDDDDDVGPKPLPTGSSSTSQADGVKQFLELEESRRKRVEEASKPKALKRDEWMLVPPKSSDLLGNLDPTKLTKSRQFNRSAAPSSSKKDDYSLWTETPAEKQQRLADEVSGKRRRATNVEDTVSPEEAAEARKRRKLDEEIRQGVSSHTKTVRGGALVEIHESKTKEDEEDPKAKMLWDHSRDMSLGGRLMDDGARQKMLRDAKGLGERFGSGTSGGFL